jgi:hypothetical protein
MLYKVKPLCVICSNDGFDPCVLFNLFILYSNLGFQVLVSENPIYCNLLVVMRGSNILLPKEFPRNIPIHVYNYVGNSIATIINKISAHPYHVFAPSQDLLEYNNVPSNRGIILVPPVYTKYWVGASNNMRTVNRKYNIVHIGNRKTKFGASEDQYTKALDQLINHKAADIWGLGWEKTLLGNLYHGSIGVMNVKHIYSKSNFALGLMYPFQRELGTFSGRFWQAPLNGAILLSEPNRYIGTIPGIIESDLVNINSSIKKKFSREEISESSVIFWNKKTSDVEEITTKILDEHPPTENRINLSMLNKFKSYTWYARSLITHKIEYLNLKMMRKI